MSLEKKHETSQIHSLSLERWGNREICDGHCGDKSADIVPYTMPGIVTDVSAILVATTT